MSKDTDALLDRVRKLLALATSPNVHEAAAAAAKAQALIEAHRLQEALDAEHAEAEDPITDGREAPLESTRRLRKWKVVLAAGLAEANGCVAYTAERGREKQILLAGRDSDRRAVAEIWDWLVKRIEWLSATEGAGQDRLWHDGFRIGAAEIVAARLARAGEEARQDARARLQSAALVKVEQALATRRAAVDRYAEEQLRLKRGRGIRVDAEAYAQGRKAGARLDLD